MSFWTDKTLEPLRKFRFSIQIGDDSQLWWAKSVSKPTYDIGSNEYQLINHKFKYPGIVTWNDIDIVIVDFKSEANTKSQDFYDKLVADGYNFEGAVGLLADGIIKNQYTDKPFLINQLGSDGKAIETWSLINPWIKSVKFGDLDYSSDDLVEITITVSYDSATLS